MQILLIINYILCTKRCIQDHWSEIPTHILMTIQMNNNNIVHFKITLDTKNYPLECCVFVKLALKEEGGYQNTIFHRVEKSIGFVGGKYYYQKDKRTAIKSVSIKAERLAENVTKGALGMVTSEKGIISTEFFIAYVDAKWLNNEYPTIGKVDEVSIDFIEKFITQEVRDENVPDKTFTIVKCEVVDADFREIKPEENEFLQKFIKLQEVVKLVEQELLEKNRENDSTSKAAEESAEIEAKKKNITTKITKPKNNTEDNTTQKNTKAKNRIANSDHQSFILNFFERIENDILATEIIVNKIVAKLEKCFSKHFTPT
ncbi:hypothetical protein COBT_002451 [Conglomerata obtusa]